MRYYYGYVDFSGIRQYKLSLTVLLLYTWPFSGKYTSVYTPRSFYPFSTHSPRESH